MNRKKIQNKFSKSPQFYKLSSCVYDSVKCVFVSSVEHEVNSVFNNLHDLFSDREHEVQRQETENHEWNSQWDQGERPYSRNSRPGDNCCKITAVPSFV